MAVKYNVRYMIANLTSKLNAKRIVIQGEIYGEGLQGNPYRLKERKLAVFNLIVDGERYNSVRAAKIMQYYKIPFVPIVSENYILPDDFEELKLQADGPSTINPQVNREGYVYRSLDGKRSFKNVSRVYLMKHNQ